MSSEKNKVPRTLFEARKVAGSATYKQYEVVLSFRINLLIQVMT